jgi:hypothetical protein
MAGSATLEFVDELDTATQETPRSTRTYPPGTMGLLASHLVYTGTVPQICVSGED